MGAQRHGAAREQLSARSPTETWCRWRSTHGPRSPESTGHTRRARPTVSILGPNWQQGILSIQPPKVGPAFPVLVPQVNEDGNERDGVRLPEITVPLATYAGWNLRDPSIGAPEQRVSFEASYLPFPRTAAERKKTGDPRKSIAERYAGREDYLTQYQKGSGRSGATTLDFAGRPRRPAPSRGAGIGSNRGAMKFL